MAMTTFGLPHAASGYLEDMADLIAALVLLLGSASAAELVRTTCRRRLLTPVSRGRSVAARTGGGPQLSG